MEQREYSKDFALMQSRMHVFAETKNTVAPWPLNFHTQEFYFRLNFLQR